MAMNLRENKMDKYDTSKKYKGFFGIQKKSQQKKVMPTQQQKKIQPVKQLSKIQSAPQPQKLQQSVEPKKIQQASKRQKTWVRKDPKKPLPEEKLNYQENVDYEKKYSQYIQHNKENVLVQWRGPEFEHYPRDKKWYTGAAIILALIILYAVFTNGIIMAIVFALIGISGYIILSQPQKEIDFAVTYDGILVGDEIYDFDDIKSFWIFYEPPHTRIISLHMRGYFRPYLHIPLHQVDPVIVHKALVEFVSEKRQEQNIVDIVERLLRM